MYVCVVYGSIFSFLCASKMFFFSKLFLAQPKITTSETPLRRTASLDALYVQPSWSRPIVGGGDGGGVGGVPATVAAAHNYAVLHMDKATQTDESYLEQIKSGDADAKSALDNGGLTSNDMKIEKVLRQRLQRGVSGGGGGAAALRSISGTEHSVSSQTLSPIHGNIFFVHF